MAIIYIDGKAHEIGEDKNLLEACLSEGYDLPYFCWHPAMGSVGACRQCAVIQYKDENDTKGKLVMSCMQPASDQTRISIKDPQATQFRKNVVEWLMANHPHDCPVCDEGGECHLQDMTVMTGHNYRRYRFPKRTYTNQYLGPFLNHEMNRCIQCYRCVRFYQDYADGRDLDVFAAHDNVYFGRHKDGTLENEFSGNLVEVCPTGVFTDKTLKQHYTRKWDLSHAPSICNQCSLGCNTIAGERYGGLRRILSRYNHEVNGYFICDRGRFGYEYVNNDTRIKVTQCKDQETGKYSSIDQEATFEKITKMMDGHVVGIGSPRASLEANTALKKLVSPNNYYAGESKNSFQLSKKILSILNTIPVKTPSLQEIRESDAVLILGEDITNTAPMMALSVRRAARNQPAKKATDLQIPHWHDAAVRELMQEEKGPVYLATPYPTKLKDIAQENYLADPDQLASFGFALAHKLDETAPDVQPPVGTEELLNKLAEDLKSAEKPLIISGMGCVHEGIVNSAANIAQAVYKHNQQVKLSYTLAENNSMGQAVLADQDLDDLMASQDGIDTLIILENDLYRKKDQKSLAAFFNKCHHIIVLDHSETQTTRQATLTIPAGTFAESEGTLINNEGRAQRFYKVFEPEETIQESWRWLEQMASKGREKTFDELVKDMVEMHAQLNGIDKQLPNAHMNIAGQKIPRQPHRYSGRTAMHAHKNVSEPQPAADKDSPLVNSMEGYRGRQPSGLTSFFWSPGWNSAQSINKYQIEVGGPLHGGNPGIRLFEPGNESTIQYFDYPTSAESPNEDVLRITPAYHIFGSEEFSSRSQAVAKRAEKPYIGLSDTNARNKNIEEGEIVTVKDDQIIQEIPVKIIRGLPEGLAVLPKGLQNFYVDFEDPFVQVTKK